MPTDPRVGQFGTTPGLAIAAFVVTALARLPVAARVVAVLLEPHAAALAIGLDDLAVLTVFQGVALTDTLIADAATGVVGNFKDLDDQVIKPAIAIGAGTVAVNTVVVRPESNLSSTGTYCVSEIKQ